jgi:hypothetical protein
LLPVDVRWVWSRLWSFQLQNLALWEANARDGLVVHDDGSFRDALIALEEEGRLD